MSCIVYKLILFGSLVNLVPPRPNPFITTCPLLWSTNNFVKVCLLDFSDTCHEHILHYTMHLHS